MAHGLLSAPASRATRQLPDQSTIIWVESFSMLFRVFGAHGHNPTSHCWFEIRQAAN